MEKSIYQDDYEKKFNLFKRWKKIHSPRTSNAPHQNPPVKREPVASKNQGKRNIFFVLLAYLIPLIILLVLVITIFNPFGKTKTYTIDVGTQKDADAAKAFYLEESKALSPRVQYGDKT